MRSGFLRFLNPTLLGLGLCAFTFLAVAGDASARPHHRKGHKAPAAAKPATPAPADTPAPAPASTPVADDQPPVTGLNADGSIRPPIIDDAPADDYQRVAWCHGVLSGDMDLAVYIKDLQPVDNTIQLIGQSYLRAYEAALTLSGQGASEAGHALADAARQRGYDGWKGALSADVKRAAWVYDSWQLPGDCEHAAVRLSGHPNLFAEMATDEEAKAVADALSSGGPHSYEDLPKPVLTANTAPEDSDAPIATNTLARRAKQASDLPAVPQDGSSSSSRSSSDTAAPTTQN